VAALRRNPNARLNAHGELTKRQAELGHGLVKAYLQSEEPARVRKALNAAQLRTVWHRVGLAPPENRWEERAAKLLDAMAVVDATIGRNYAAFEKTWRAVTGDDRDLRAIDSSRIRTFLELRDSPDLERPKPLVAPMLPIAEGAIKRGGEPLRYWIFSRQNPVLKLQMAIAMLLVVVALTMSAWHGVQMRSRDRAWAATERAATAGDDFAILTACEQFFDTSPTDQDPRTSQARDIYRKTLVHWFLNLSGQPDTSALRHVQRYRQLAANWSANGGAQ